MQRFFPFPLYQSNTMAASASEAHYYYNRISNTIGNISQKKEKELGWENA